MLKVCTHKNITSAAFIFDYTQYIGKGFGKM